MKLFMKIKILMTWNYWIILLLNSCLVLSKSPSCSICNNIAEDFKEGLKKTARSHFGGGDADWEESRLGSFSKSETRLIEIIEELYKSGKETPQMVEKYEHLIEKYWFEEFSKKKDADFHSWFCIDNVKACCPENTFGPNCTECTGGVTKPCSGNGNCDGGGTREGTGKCNCDAGYDGDLCDRCSDGYYEDVESETTKCLSCHESCKDTCSEGGVTGCDECKSGWIWDDEKGCQDVNECERDPPVCSEKEFCINNQGSYTCQGCDTSCDGCYGSGNDKCSQCKEGYKNEDNVCIDIDECEADTSLCSGNSYCKNIDGSYKCQECDSSCDGCHGAGSDKCTECKKGYKLEDDVCTDIDECLNEKLCRGENEKCINIGGSYMCGCQSGYEKVKSKCVKSIEPISRPKTKNKKSDKKKTKKKNEHKPPFWNYIIIIASYGICGYVSDGKIYLTLPLTCLIGVYIYWFSSQYDR